MKALQCSKKKTRIRTMWEVRRMTRSRMRKLSVFSQCLSPTPNYTEDIHENLKIFDRLFSEFEFSYVSCMVHVKTVKGEQKRKI